MTATIVRTEANKIEIKLSDDMIIKFHELLSNFVGLFTGTLCFDYSRGIFFGNYSFNNKDLTSVFIKLFLNYMKGLSE